MLEYIFIYYYFGLLNVKRCKGCKGSLAQPFLKVVKMGLAQPFLKVVFLKVVFLKVVYICIPICA